MAFDAFLKIDGIKGESQDAKHKGEIDIYTFNWGAVLGRSPGSGMAPGRVAIQDFTFREKVDYSSPFLFAHCTAGTHFAQATFVVRKAGGTQMEYLKYKFTDLLISNINPHGTAAQLYYQDTKGGVGGTTFTTITEHGGDVTPWEDVSFNFAKVEVSYQPQGSDGNPQGGPIMAGWDIKANKKV